MQPPNNLGPAAGLTIVEVLVSIALLSVIVLVVLTPLTGFFGLTRQSNTQIGATQQVQRAIESLRGDWLTTSRYDQVCSTQYALFNDLTLEITNLNVMGDALGSATLRDCTAPAGSDTSPLRRVKVSKSVQGKVLSSLTVEIDRK